MLIWIPRANTFSSIGQAPTEGFNHAFNRTSYKTAFRRLRQRSTLQFRKRFVFVTRAHLSSRNVKTTPSIANPIDLSPPDLIAIHFDFSPTPLALFPSLRRPPVPVWGSTGSLVGKLHEKTGSAIWQFSSDSTLPHSNQSGLSWVAFLLLRMSKLDPPWNDSQYNQNSISK